MSHEYVSAIALTLYGILKAFGVELENGTLEGIITGLVALYIAYRRKTKGDIDALGRRVG